MVRARGLPTVTTEPHLSHEPDGMFVGMDEMASCIRAALQSGCSIIPTAVPGTGPSGGVPGPRAEQ